jgi:predicted TIM-barrel fold metal-dependent hydrolase
MKIGFVLVACIAATACARPAVDPGLARFIAGIRAIDNHTHVASTAPVDSESDALPLDGLLPFPFPARLSPDHPDWLPAYRALYGYKFDDLTEPHRAELRAAMARVRREQGDHFPAWVLDKIGTEVMVANRIAMGPGLVAPRFRWVSYVDALLLPLSTAAEREATPDYRVLYPLEDRLLHRYLTDLHLAKLPATLDGYLRDVVTPTLERQKEAGCIAVKFEAAYLRALDFDDASREDADRVYAQYVAGGIPPHGDYKTLQDFLFRYIAREAGRLGMAVHIHSFEGAGGFYRAAGSDPLLLEPALNDSTLRGTKFVILHGGGNFAAHTDALFWKPNVYADISFMAIDYPPSRLAQVLAMWLVEFPDRVLFGTDAFGSGPDAGWEVAAWVGTTTARRALAIALSTLMRNGELSRGRAEEIATMVLRGNAARLYHIGNLQPELPGPPR